jgi:branched-subunit amino acid ABC-type transport system permease component
VTFAMGAWIAGICGALVGGAMGRPSRSGLAGATAVFDAVMKGAVGAFLAVLAFGILSMLEGWAAFFQRRASPAVPLLFTLVMLAGWVTASEVAARRRKHDG